VKLSLQLSRSMKLEMLFPPYSARYHVSSLNNLSGLHLWGGDKLSNAALSYRTFFEQFILIWGTVQYTFFA
jgi:hypothetical protein